MAEERLRSTPGWRVPLTILLTALLAGLGPLRQPEWWIDGATFSARVWHGTGWLLAAPAEGARAILIFRLLLLGGVVLLGTCAARLAREQGGGVVAATAAGSFTVASAAGVALLHDPAGVLQLVAALAFVVTALAAWCPVRRPTTAIVAGLVAAVASAGALVPGLLLLCAARPRIRPGRSVWPAAVAVAAVAVVALLIARGTVVGLAAESAVRLPEATLSTARAETLADVLWQWLASGAGAWSRLPYLDSWQPASSAGGWPIAIGGLVLLVAALQIPVATVRLALCGLLASGSAVAVTAAAGTLPLISVAAALPGLACTAAALATALPRCTFAAAAELSLATLCGVAGPQAPSELLASSAHPVLAARSDLRDGTTTAREAAVGAAANGRRSLASWVGWELGGDQLRRAQREHGDAAALEWIERWRSLRPAAAPPLPALEARQLDLLLRQYGPERAASWLAPLLELRAEDAAWRAAMAGALVDALHRRATDVAFVTALLPLVEPLLAAAAARPELASAEELQCLALLRVGQQRLVEAVTLAERAIKAAPDRPGPHLVLARIYLGRGEFRAGLEEVARALKLAPDDPASLLLEGRLCCSNADVAQHGVARMVQALDLDPTLAGVHEELEAGAVQAADVLVARGQLDAARAAVGRAIDAVGRRLPLLRAYARVAVQQRALGAAVALLEEVHAAAPDDADVRRELAEACRDSGYAALLQQARDDAMRCFARALEVAPDGFDGDGMRALLAQQRAREEAARDPAVEVARSAFEEALLLHRGGDLPGAAAALRRSLASWSLNPLGHLWLGRVLLELGEAKAAEAALRTAIAVGAVQRIEVEAAWPLLLDALQAQEVEATKVNRVVDDYLREFPAGRHRERFEAARVP